MWNVPLVTVQLADHTAQETLRAKGSAVSVAGSKQVASLTSLITLGPEMAVGPRTLWAFGFDLVGKEEQGCSGWTPPLSSLTVPAPDLFKDGRGGPAGQ